LLVPITLDCHEAAGPTPAALYFPSAVILACIIFIRQAGFKISAMLGGEPPETVTKEIQYA